MRYTPIIKDFLGENIPEDNGQEPKKFFYKLDYFSNIWTWGIYRVEDFIEISASKNEPKLPDSNSQIWMTLQTLLWVNV